LIWGASWDNVRALSTYKGPVEVFGALQDTVIPFEHARRLASRILSVRFHSIEGGPIAGDERLFLGVAPALELAFAADRLQFGREVLAV
jgi:hypothetical protein